MSDPDPRQHPHDDLPKAKVGRDWKRYLFWLVPVAAAMLAGYFIYSNMKKGPKIHIYFSDATRLEEKKSNVMYRGAIIGQVEKIELAPDQKQVDVTVRLDKSAKDLAREGSKFWIVRAQISAGEFRGLATIVSGDYIGVEPGGGKSATDFQGVAQAPVVVPPGTLRIVLLAERLNSLQPRAPVYYRGVQVGEVGQVDLGPQAQDTRIAVDIQLQYAPLIRMNTVFWRAGGVEFNLGFGGANISAQSLKTLISGGIDLATPDTTQKPAPPGTAFLLNEKPQEEWLKWHPAIQLPIGDPATRPATSPSPGGAI